MEDILDKIIAFKQEEVARQEAEMPCPVLERRAAEAGPVRSMRRAIENSSSGIIAEFKRRSPSSGWIARDADVAAVASGYAVAGAAAVSVLTDTHFFGGSLDDLAAARAAVDTPLLRKDFIISPYQLLQARAYGADAVLLIASVLTVDRACGLSRIAHGLGLEVLLEIHSVSESGITFSTPRAVLSAARDAVSSGPCWKATMAMCRSCWAAG